MTVVTYLWGTAYRRGHVQQLARSVARFLAMPHRFVCITDKAIPGVETLKNPAPQFPARCYRRLWLFSAEAAQVLGDRVLHLDLDLVVCGPLDAIAQRASDFAIYRAASIARRGYSLNPSVFLLRTGTQRDLWERFVRDPQRLAHRANADGFWGSDQAVISHLRKEHADTFDDADGIVSFRQIRAAGWTAPPAGTCIVSFHGRRTPFDRAVQSAHPWIASAWQEAA
jgi:hypothetical protein